MKKLVTAFVITIAISNQAWAGLQTSNAVPYDCIAKVMGVKDIGNTVSAHTPGLYKVPDAGGHNLEAYLYGEGGYYRSASQAGKAMIMIIQAKACHFRAVAPYEDYEEIICNRGIRIENYDISNCGNCVKIIDNPVIVPCR